MSIAAIRWAKQVGKDKHLPQAARHVLSDLADMVGQGESHCWPSFQTIADNTGLSRRAVINAIKVLESESLVRRERRVNVGKGYGSNRYWLMVTDHYLKKYGAKHG